MDRWPTLEEMLIDLSKVEGLEPWLSLIAAVMEIDPNEAYKPIPYELTDAGREALK